jgi:hypothetical protein
MELDKLFYHFIILLGNRLKLLTLLFFMIAKNGDKNRNILKLNLKESLNQYQLERKYLIYECYI